MAAKHIHNVWLSTKNIHNVWLLQLIRVRVHGRPAGLGFAVNLADRGGARRLRQIILPSFLSYYPRPSLSPPFDLRIFPVSCALEREGVDSRLCQRLTCNILPGGPHISVLAYGPGGIFGGGNQICRDRPMPSIHV